MAQLNLYCAEDDGWDEEEEGHYYQQQQGQQQGVGESIYAPPLLHLNPPSPLTDEQLTSDDDELDYLYSKERTHKNPCLNYLQSLQKDPLLDSARRDAVEWILSVISHYTFNTQTALLSVFFLDTFLSGLHFQREKPWMTQLAAVTCLCLGAKMEETQVPLLLDLQVEESKFIFEARTIQRMELLVMSTLEWKMNSLTPLTFIDHIVRKLGLKTRLHWDFFRRCEQLLLTLITDSRFMGYIPSILATSVMLSVVYQMGVLINQDEYENRILSFMRINKENVGECLDLVEEYRVLVMDGRPNKRKFHDIPSVPNSPRGVFDASFNSDGTNDSWASSGSSVSSSPAALARQQQYQQQQQQGEAAFSELQPVVKKIKLDDDVSAQQLVHYPYFLDFYGSPPSSYP